MLVGVAAVTAVRGLAFRRRAALALCPGVTLVVGLFPSTLSGTAKRATHALVLAAAEPAAASTPTP